MSALTNNAILRSVYDATNKVLKISSSSSSSGGTLTVLTSASGSYTAVSTTNMYWTVPSGEKWTVRSVVAALVTTGTAGNRAIAVGHTNDDGTPKVYAIAVSQVTQSASLTYSYSFAIGQPDSASVRTGNIVPCTLPYLQLSAGDRLVILEQSGSDSADAITPRAIVEVETV
jgi:hypothetical protein